jgi:dTDP-glucose 4,6-dehydratase
MRTVIVTGGLGFIGSHLIKALLHDTSETQIINVDARTYAAVGGSRFATWPEEKYSDDLMVFGARFNERHLFLCANVANAPDIDGIFDCYKPDAVIHLAAESHVDRSIDDAVPFIKSNLFGTHVLLDACIRHGCSKFTYVSTDEVYGPVPLGVNMGFVEDDALNPRNPYSATKAGAEHLVMAYHHTYGLETRITRGCNTYGSYQHPEKFLPLFILNAMEGKPLPLYGDGNQEREWLHVKDHVEAILYAADHGESGEVYNVGSGESHTNLAVARAICDKMGQPHDLIQTVPDRPGHDRRYSIVPTRLDGLWAPTRHKFLQDDPGASSGLSEIIQWYTSREGQAWCTNTEGLDRKRRGTRKQEQSE